MKKITYVIPANIGYVEINGRKYKSNGAVTKITIVTFGPDFQIEQEEQKTEEKK